jgi:hypothetical protein
MLAGDRLYVIDNEWISLDAADFDLARTFTRWPMSEAAWARFIAAYGMDPGPLDFWKIVSAVLSARARLRKAPDRLDAALDALRGLSASSDVNVLVICMPERGTSSASCR